MRLLFFLLIFFSSLANNVPNFERAYAQSALPNKPSTSNANEAQQVLERARPAIVQIKGFFGTNTVPAFHGTGFAVAEKGISITNYHVVAQRVHDPDRYHLEYETVEGKKGKVVVVAVDLRHDLAIVRTIGYEPAPLSIKSEVPSKGSKAFAIGYPLDVGLTITEGISNGRVADSFNARIHYSGALNGGMSGGPTLNEKGEVIGVNVSGYVFSQLVSFLVPGDDAVVFRDRVLNEKLKDEKIDVKALQKAAVAQMKAHSKALLDRLNGFISTQVVSGYRLPGKLSKFVNCSATSKTEPKQPVEMTLISCSANAGLLIENGLSSGNLEYSHKILSSKTLGAWRFAKKLSGRTLPSGLYGKRKHVGPFACENQIVGLKGFDANIMMCVRSHRKLDGLYDFATRVVSLNGKTQGFVNLTKLYGVEFDSGMKFMRSFVGAMEYVP